MPRSFPLRWKILSWFFVNLALIALGVFLLFRAQFRVGIDSLLNGPTGDRLEALARPLAAELRTLPRTQWGTKRWVTAFERATAGWRERGLQAALVRNDGLLIAGEVPALPPEIRQVLENFDRRKRAGFGPGPPMMRGGPGGGGDRNREGPNGGWTEPRGFDPRKMGYERRGAGQGPGAGPGGGGEFWEAREIRPPGTQFGDGPPNRTQGSSPGAAKALPPVSSAGGGNEAGHSPQPGADARDANIPGPGGPPLPSDDSGNRPPASPDGDRRGPDFALGDGMAMRPPSPEAEGEGGRGRRWAWPPFPEGSDFRGSSHFPQPPGDGGPDARTDSRLKGQPGPFSPPLNPFGSGAGGSGAAQAYGPLQKFMLVAGSPRTYWAGVHLDGAALTSPEPGPLPFTLLIASSSLRGGGLFFDYLPWLVLGGALLTGSVLLWLPFVQRLTKALGGLTNSAEAIARGQFDPPPVSGRRDELGRLQRAHRDMAARLEGFVTGQKRFLGDTAHELLSPIARLEVGLSILETRVTDEDARYIDRALGEVRQMSALVQDLLSFTKAGLRRPDVLPQSVVLADLAHEAVERETADTGAEVEVNVSIPGNSEVLALPSLLSRAIGNVVRNAVRYAADDGPILLSAEKRAGSDEGGNGRASGETVILTISDHGPGVPEDALPRLFDPFYRPDTSRAQATGGTGLGLAIVKTAVEACGGTVTVRNGVPHGLVVEIVLQAAPPAEGKSDRSV